ncbi:hypothetical protein [Streptomyces sp. NPDC088748]|uniref:hypothetical protein n=1 Tax=Streptomyces sp. NPDC088748 TaxID=3365887 RepID=UPI00381D7797
MQSSDSPSRESPQELASRGIAHLESYLQSQRLKAEATQAGSTFANQLIWLAPIERAEIARLFANEYILYHRKILHQTKTRTVQLQTEYARHYNTLRRRLTALTLGFVIMSLVIFPAAFRIL